MNQAERLKKQLAKDKSSGANLESGYNPYDVGNKDSNEYRICFDDKSALILQGDRWVAYSNFEAEVEATLTERLRDGDYIAKWEVKAVGKEAWEEVVNTFAVLGIAIIENEFFCYCEESEDVN